MDLWDGILRSQMPIRDDSALSMRIAFYGNAHIHARDYMLACLDDARIEVVGAAAVERTPYDFPPHIPIVEAAQDLRPHDVCVVASDIAAHGAHVASARAPHVLVEKPLGMNSSDARRTAELIERGQSSFHTGMFLRHAEPLRRLREELHDGTIGAVRAVNLTYAHSGLRDGWLRDWPAHMDADRMGYGVFGDLAAHLIDFARWCLVPEGDGRPDGGRCDPDPLLVVESCHLEMIGGIDAAGTARLRAPDGVPVTLAAGGLAPGRDLTLRVQGEAGTLAIVDDALVIELPDGTVERLTRPADITPRSGFAAELDAVAEGRASPGATLPDMIAVNVVLDALYEAAERAEAAILAPTSGA